MWETSTFMFSSVKMDSNIWVDTNACFVYSDLYVTGLKKSVQHYQWMQRLINIMGKLHNRCWFLEIQSTIFTLTLTFIFLNVIFFIEGDG